jgi:hypothetical protein
MDMNGYQCIVDGYTMIVSMIVGLFHGTSEHLKWMIRGYTHDLGNLQSNLDEL